jgi:pimeloyl-ACP methyl ester carboxylesterase
MASYAGFSESSPQPFPQASDVSGHATRKRRLLTIYIHGFCGSEDSFGQFPSHVHSFLKQALCDTHVVYSKIYPQYETRNAMEIAVEKFSRWLQPHEDSQTDVILVGHSLGGILAAQAAMLVSAFSVSKCYCWLIVNVEKVPLFNLPVTLFSSWHNIVGLSFFGS